jgi:Tfp pilus assembly protein PilO
MSRFARRPVVIGVAAALAVLVIWFLFLWSPQGSKLSDARDRKDNAEREQQELQARIDRLKSLKQDEPAKRAQLENLRVAIPDEPNLAQFILDANSAANVSGINFLSISPSPPTAGTATGAASSATPPTTAPEASPGAAAPAAAPAVINLQLSISGGYFQVVDFVNRLNDLPRLVVIDSLGLTSGGTGTAGATTLSVAIAARMFVSAPTAVSGSGGPAGGGGAATTTVPGATTTTAPGSGSSTTTAAP